MSRSVLILEDEADRVARFRVVLAKVDPQLEIALWENAHEMIRDLPTALSNSVFISLDHDLYTEDASDPGDGLDVARYLAEQEPACPVIIHSSNSPRAQRMTGVLELEGWQVARSVPLGENWVEEDWRYVVSEILTKGRTSASSNEWSRRHRRIVRGLIDCRNPADESLANSLAQRHDGLPVFRCSSNCWLLTDDGRVVISDGDTEEERTDFVSRISAIIAGAQTMPVLRKLVPDRPRGAPDCECAEHKGDAHLRCPKCGGLGWLFPK